MHFFKRKASPIVAPLVPSVPDNPSELPSSEIAFLASPVQPPLPSEEYLPSVSKRNRCQRCCSKESLKEQALLIATIVSVALGVAIGISLRGIKCPTGTLVVHRLTDRARWHRRFLIVADRIDGCRITKEDISYIDFPGLIFINVLKMLILPLIVSSIISSLAQLDAQSAGKMGARALVYYLSTTLIAAIIGIILVLTIRPGKRSGKAPINPNSKTAEGRTIDTVLDLLRYAENANVLFVIFDRICLEIYFRKTSWKPHFVPYVSLLRRRWVLFNVLLDWVERNWAETERDTEACQWNR